MQYRQIKLQKIADSWHLLQNPKFLVELENFIMFYIINNARMTEKGGKWGIGQDKTKLKYQRGGGHQVTQILVSC